MNDLANNEDAQYYPGEQALQAIVLGSINRSLDSLPADRQAFIREFWHICQAMTHTMVQKNSDYSSESPWGNLVASAQWGVSPQLGVLIRMTDKWTRLQNLAKKGFAGDVQSESFDDTLLDLAVYAIFVLMMRKEGLHK